MSPAESVQSGSTASTMDVLREMAELDAGSGVQRPAAAVASGAGVSALPDKDAGVLAPDGGGAAVLRY